MKYYKLIVLVHAYQNELYDYFRKKYISLDNSKFPNIKIFFVYGNSGINIDNKTDNDIIYPDINENKISPSILLKTLRAFEYIHKNYEYEFLIRISASTILLFDHFLNFLNSLPNSMVFGGPKALKRSSSRGFARGCALLFSRDVIEYTIDNQATIFKKYDVNISDDSIITWFLEDNLKIKTLNLFNQMYPIENYFNVSDIDFDNTIKIANKEKKLFFRIKNRNRQQVDTIVFDKLFKNYYKNELFDRTL